MGGSCVDQPYKGGGGEGQDERCGVAYGGSVSYRKMCRWYAGWFWWNEITAQFRWYWRVDPGIGFYCDMLEDPFESMQRRGERFSFVITLSEYKNTVQGLWEATRGYVAKKAAEVVEVLAEDNSLAFLADDPEKGMQAELLTHCHFWSNFEIGDMGFFRSDAYREYFEYLDKEGGFFYQRWGDAPVHSIAAALFLRRDEIRWWGEVGYSHEPFGRCPWDEESYTHGRCRCPYVGEKSFDRRGYSCLPRWWRVNGECAGRGWGGY